MSEKTPEPPPHGRSAESRERRDPRLDGLRGLAILLVMLYHTTHYGFARTPLDVAATILPSVGWSGVDLFFVLSGYLITGILLGTRGGPHYFRSFYARRALRIFPLYYAVLAFFFFVLPQIDAFAQVDYLWVPGSDRETVWYWLYLSNVKVALTGGWHHQALAISWSLAIEEQFYLIWPLLVRSLSERRLLWLCGGVFLGAFVLRLALIIGGANALIPYTATPCRLDTLAAGAAIALLVRRGGGVVASLERAAAVLLPAALAVFAGCYAWGRLHTGPVDAASSYDEQVVRTLGFLSGPLMQTVGFSALCVLYAALLVRVSAAPSGSLLARVFELPLLQSFGRYSYAMYLLHYFVALVVLSAFQKAYQGPYLWAQLQFWLCAIGITYGAARLTWVLLEEPMQRLRRFFPYAGAPRPAAPEGAAAAEVA
jgi:peptidoglycan/LPS O-acetylase OafA/YrhL